ARGRLGVRGGEALDLVPGRGGAAARRLDLAAQLGQALPPVGDRLVRGDQRLLRLGEPPLQPLPLLYRRGQPLLRALRGRPPLRLLRADLLRFGGQLLRVAPRALVLRGGRQVPQPFAGQLVRGPEPFLQRRQLVPGLLRPFQQRRVGSVVGLQRRQP